MEEEHMHDEHEHRNQTVTTLAEDVRRLVEGVNVAYLATLLPGEFDRGQPRDLSEVDCRGRLARSAAVEDDDALHGCEDDDLDRACSLELSVGHQGRKRIGLRHY